MIAARKAFRVEQLECDPNTRVFVDEFGINLGMTRRYARSPQGTRAVDKVPGRSQNITLVFGLRPQGVIAPNVIAGAMTTDLFAAYAQDTLGPELKPGDVVVLDNLSAHKGAQAAREVQAHGACIELLPPYSPDLTPIENCGSKVKEALRKAAARSWDDLVEAVDKALRSVTPDDVYGWLKHAGFRPKLE